MDSRDTKQWEDRILLIARSNELGLEVEDKSFVLTALIMATMRYAAHDIDMAPCTFLEMIATSVARAMKCPPEDLLEFVAEGMRAEKEAAKMRQN